MPSRCPAPSTAGRGCSPTTAPCRSSACLRPPSSYAERGFVVSPRVAADWALTGRISHHAGAKKHLFRQGEVPREGEVMQFPALARTLKIIAREGREGFYAGEVAKDIVAELNALGGLHTLADFAAQRCSYVTPHLALLPRRRPLRASAQQPGHHRADAAQDPGEDRAAQGPRLGRALPRADRGGAARLRHARPPSSPIPTWPTCPSSTCCRTPSSTTSPSACTASAAARTSAPCPSPPGSDTVYFCRRRREGHGGVLHQLALRRLRLRHRHEQDRRRPAQPRQGLRLRSRPPQLHRTRQAADAHAGAGHGAQGRQALHGLRRHGRALPAHGPRLRHDQHVPLRHGPAGGDRHPARVPRRRDGAGGGVGAGVRRRRPRGARPPRCRAPHALGRRAGVVIDRDNGVLVGASDGRKDGMALGY